MRVLLFLPLFITLVVASKHQKSSQEQEVDHMEEDAVVAANKHFSVDLFKEVSSRGVSSPKQNVFVSPFSISVSFAMLSLGAKSESHDQIVAGLRFPQSRAKDANIHKGFQRLLDVLNRPKQSLQFLAGTAVFIDSNLKASREFQSDAQQYYKAEIMPANFNNRDEALRQINNYVKDKTNGKIKDIVSSVDDQAKMVLVNYVLFKGEWLYTFPPKLTQQGKFSVDAHTQVDVSMMKRIGYYKKHRDSANGCELIEMPYKEGANLLIIVPKIGTIEAVEAAICIKQIKDWRRSLRTAFLEFSMPKVSIATELNLQKPLSSMGMADIFTSKADFSGITNQVKLRVNKAIHKAVLNVNEYGTEAYGTTTVEMTPTSAPPKLTIDRPFITVLYSEESDTILFMGRISDPTKK